MNLHIPYKATETTSEQKTTMENVVSREILSNSSRKRGIEDVEEHTVSVYPVVVFATSKPYFDEFYSFHLPYHTKEKLKEIDPIDVNVEPLLRPLEQNITENIRLSPYVVDAKDILYADVVKRVFSYLPEHPNVKFNKFPFSNRYYVVISISTFKDIVVIIGISTNNEVKKVESIAIAIASPSNPQRAYKSTIKDIYRSLSFRFGTDINELEWDIAI